MINCPVVMYADKELTGMFLMGMNRLRILAGVLSGTVFSGHPSRTTFGNTLRILLLMYAVCLDIGCVFGVDVHVFQSGDDTYVIIEREWIDRFRAGLLKYYSEVEGVTHGYGQLMKDFQILGNRIDFLSKVGWVTKHKCVIFRNPARLFATGSMTDNTTMSDAEYNYAITCSLEAAYKGFPGMDELLLWRRENLPHAFTKKRDYVYEIVKEVHHENVSWEDLGPYEKDFKILQSMYGDSTGTLLTTKNYMSL